MRGGTPYPDLLPAGGEKEKQKGATMGFVEKGAVRIHYEEAGSGFPLLLIAGGGLNSCIERITGPYPPFNAMKEFSDEYRCPGNPQARSRSTAPGIPTPTISSR
jgi:hypothetical protein